MTLFPLIYSLIIPCYNEGSNLPDLIERCRNIISKQQNLEIVFVNNGSLDNSEVIFGRYINAKTEPRLRFINIKKNRGYGFGVLSGLKAAKGDAMGWTHADLQTDPADFLKAIKIYENSNDRSIFIKGKRQKRNIRDQFFTSSMTFFEYALLGYWMDDINAQPNLFHRSFFEKLFSSPNDFSIDLYFFFSALEKGILVKRFPVFFRDRQSGVGHNETLSAKIRYSYSTIRYSFKLKKSLKKQTK